MNERPAIPWRALAISILVAVVLSVTATLLLGGSFRVPGGTVFAGCGSVGSCCPPSPAHFVERFYERK